MKKVFYFAAALVCLLFASCAPRIQFTRVVALLDLRPLTNDGFFITESDAVGFDYQAIGVMSLLEISGEDKNYETPKTVIEKNTDDDLYYKSYVSKPSKHWKNANGYSALSELVRKAKEEGGNGIINLKVKYNYEYVNGRPSNLVSVEATGMVIKR